jgi:hypothetical protein
LFASEFKALPSLERQGNEGHKNADVETKIVADNFRDLRTIEISATLQGRFFCDGKNAHPLPPTW